MPRALARLKYPINYPHDVAKLRLEYDTPTPTTVDVDAVRRFEEGRIIYESPLIDYHSYLRLIQPIVRDGLVAEWLFFEGSGTILHDTSGQGNHGTIYGSTWQKLATGKWVLHHDGIDDYEEVPNAPSLNPDYITVEACVMMPEYPSKIQHILTKPYLSATSPWHQYTLTVYPDGSFLWECNIGGKLYSLDSGVDLEVGRFYHLVGTYDGLEMCAYVNGVLQDTLSVSGTITKYDTPLWLARWYTKHLNVVIALVRIYNLALSADEISELYELAKLIVPLE